MRIVTLLKHLLGLGYQVVVTGYELIEAEGQRPHLVVRIRPAARQGGRCGRCGMRGGWYDNGGGLRRGRHVELAYATVELEAVGRRVLCPEHGPTVAAVAWARHGSAFTRAFEDLVVYDTIASNKTAAARRHGVSWRAVDGMCTRLVDEALAGVDLLEGLVAIAIDEVKYNYAGDPVKGQRYLTVVCDHLTGQVVWAAKGRSKKIVAAFFDKLGAARAARLEFVTCDGAEWIHGPVRLRVEAHQRDLRIEQRVHRPHPRQRPGLPRPRSVHQDDHARPRQPRPRVALGHRLMTPKTDSCPLLRLFPLLRAHRGLL